MMPAPSHLTDCIRRPKNDADEEPSVAPVVCPAALSSSHFSIPAKPPVMLTIPTRLSPPLMANTSLCSALHVLAANLTFFWTLISTAGTATFAVTTHRRPFHALSWFRGDACLAMRPITNSPCTFARRASLTSPRNPRESFHLRLGLMALAGSQWIPNALPVAANRTA